jgi:Colicin immunity protein / pyocin immunity protein
MMTDRESLIEIAERLIGGDYQSDEALDRDMAEFAAAVPHPHASNLIYYWQDEFDHQPTAEEVVDRALNYRPIQL